MNQKRLNILLLVALVLGMLPATAPQSRLAAAPATDNTTVAQDVSMVTGERGQVLYEEKGATGLATYILQLEAAPLASYRGELAGLAATSPAATGARKLDVKSQASVTYRNYLARERTTVLGHIERAIGRVPSVRDTYDVAYNGLAIELTPDEAAVVANLPGVVRVQRNFQRYIDTDTSPTFLDAVGIWDGINTGGLAGTMGEGIVVGIIDTGINMDHVSFADIGDDGYDHTNPLGAGIYKGWCNPDHPSYDPALMCNDKLIGVYSYPDSGDNPEDDHSHGSHTASTTAGNVVHGPSLDAGLIFDQISGMAPHANIIAYDVCTPDSGCPGTAIMAGIEDAVADGVDVINYSIGGGPYDPWAGADSLAYLAARDAGIFVASSAGNEGPGAGTVGSPGNSPWMTTVANATHDRGFDPNGIEEMEGGTTPPEDMPGTGISGAYGPARIVHARDYGNALCGTGPQDTATNPFAPGTWDGEIVVCDRGTYYLVDKAAFVREAGAGGIVIANMVEHGDQTYATDLGMPGTHVTFTNAEMLRSWLINSSTNLYTATITVSPIVHDAALADVLSVDSSRGPNVVPDIIKPDIMAPGTNVLAAYAGDAEAYGMMSGTSMASPHVAGAGALLSALLPGWTEAEIQSALMMTSRTGALKDDGVTPADPFDVGAGGLDLTGAALAGLVLDETTANFLAANPTIGGDPTTLNLASLGSAACLGECTWTRTFRNTAGKAVTWAVASSGDVHVSADPMTFTVAAGATQVVTFTGNPGAYPPGVWVFGQVTLTPDDPTMVALHLPVAVTPATGVLPPLAEINTRRNAGSQSIDGLKAITVTELTIETFGLVQGTLHDISLNQDPTNDDAFDDLSQVYVTEFSISGSAARRLVAEITASEAPDVDLFLEVRISGVWTEVCSSTTPSWDESCDIANPSAGQYRVVVQNWQGSDSQPDAIKLSTAVVPGADAGNMIVVGPASVPALESFALEVFWDTPTMVAGDRWYGVISLGTSAETAGDIGTLPVTVVRHADDVVKSASATTARWGDTVTYALTVLPNVTPTDLTYVLTDTIPAGLTYVADSALATAGVVDVADDTLTWTGTQPAGGTSLVAITYEVTVDDGVVVSPVTNTAVHTVDNPGSLPAETSYDLAVVPPGLEITKTVTPEVGVDLGDTVTYTVVLSHVGLATAADIIISDTLPSGLTFGAFVDDAGGTAAEDAGVVTWTGMLTSGSNVTIVFTATVAEDLALRATPISNTVMFTSANYGDGEATATFTVVANKIYLPLIVRNDA